MLSERIGCNAWAEHTVQALFRATCEEKTDKAALVFEGEAITFGALQERVDILTQALLDAGIGKGDVVATLPSPTPEFAVAFLAALQAGAVINPLNLMWERDVLAAILRRNAPRLLVTVAEYGKRDYVALLQDCLAGASPGSGAVGVPDQIVVVGARRELPDGFQTWADFVAGASEPDLHAIEARVRAFDPRDDQFICQTSGSTGLPKSALWNHRPPLATANFTALQLALSEDDSYINLSPLFHNSGMCASLTMALVYAGNTLYMSERFDPEEAVRIIQQEGVAATFGFGAHWHAMSRAPSFDARRFNMNKVIIAGDTKLYDFVQGLCGNDSTVVNLYAQTENGPMVALTERGNINRELRRINNGRPLPGVEVRVRDIDSGAPLADGEPGELCYRGPYLFSGYLQEDGSIIRPLDADGFFGSGDYGFVRDGYVTYIERLGGVVKSGGENVSLAKVAGALGELFTGEFEEIHAVAIPDPYWGDRVVGVGIPRAGVEWSTADLRARCKNALAAYEIPRNFVAWEEPWPVSAEGKLGVRALQQHAAANVDVSER